MRRGPPEISTAALPREDQGGAGGISTAALSGEPGGGRGGAPAGFFGPKTGKARPPPRRYRAHDLLQSGTDGNHPAAALELKWRRLLGAAATPFWDSPLAGT